MTTEYAEPVQRELALRAPELSGDLPLLPPRMVNEYQYCPRLAYLEWVQGEWAESGDTIEGRFQHRRVDNRPAPCPIRRTSIPASASMRARSRTSRLGLIAKLDLVEGEGDMVTPVDYKRGKRPHVPKGPYDPDACSSACRG